MRIFIVHFTLSYISFARIIFIILADSCFSTAPLTALLRCCICLLVVAFCRFSLRRQADFSDFFLCVLLFLFSHLWQREDGRTESGRCTCGYMFVVVNLLVRITLFYCFYFIATMLSIKYDNSFSQQKKKNKTVRSALRNFPEFFSLFHLRAHLLSRALTHTCSPLATEYAHRFCSKFCCCCRFAVDKSAASCCKCIRAGFADIAVAIVVVLYMCNSHFIRYILLLLMSPTFLVWYVPSYMLLLLF